MATAIDWSETPENDPVTRGMADAADMNLGLPYALVHMALDMAYGISNSKLVTRAGIDAALAEVLYRYEHGEFKGY